MPQRVVILGSGSRGNSLLAAARRTRVLVDMGFSERRITRQLLAEGVDPDKLSAVLVTHTHGDHVGASALRFCFRHRVPLVAPRENLAVLRRKFGPTFERLDRGDLLRPLPPRGLEIDGLAVRPFEVPHDADGLNLGYHLTLADGRSAAPLRVVVATDLGHVPPEVLAVLADAEILVLEANHDPRLLADSGRPPDLIERIRGPHGHLANDQAALVLQLILSLRDPGALRRVVLAHLSQECNTPRLALAAARRVLRAVDGPAPPLSAATQDESLKVH